MGYLELRFARESGGNPDAPTPRLEHRDIPDILADCKMKGVGIDLDDVTYCVGSETIEPAEDGRGLPFRPVALFAATGRNVGRTSDYLQLPRDQVVKIGRQIEI